MSATYDLATDIGNVRLLISDVDVADAERCIFSDEEIRRFLAMNRGVKRAAAAALDAIASMIAQTSRDITTQDLSTYGSRTADSVRRQASALREQADHEVEVLVW